MIDIKEKTKCSGCYACYNICPKNAIKMIEDEKGFYYPKVNKEKCIDCGLCDKICPILNKTNINNFPKAFAVYNKDEDIRKNSSSGGVFTLLAEKILEKGGIVFGARFDKNFNVVHDFIEKKEDIEVFRGSKYVQSKIGDTYKRAEELLKSNRPVLFTGTPCQIEGLKSFLRKDYDNLYTQDLICHGVPSKKVNKEYLKYLEKKNNAKLINVLHRNKDLGWKNWNVNMKFSNNKIYKNSHNTDLYMKVFLQNISLRDSCYACAFKKKNRISDITLADFWGIENVLPEMDDNKGTSLVIINSEKGRDIFNEIQDKVIFKEVDFENAISYNTSIFQSANMNKNREKFFEDLGKLDFDKLVKKYQYNSNILRKILSKVKKLIKN